MADPPDEARRAAAATSASEAEPEDALRAELSRFVLLDVPATVSHTNDLILQITKLFSPSPPDAKPSDRGGEEILVDEYAGIERAVAAEAQQVKAYNAAVSSLQSGSSSGSSSLSASASASQTHHHPLSWFTSSSAASHHHPAGLGSSAGSTLHVPFADSSKRSWTKAALELDGCVLRKGSVTTRFTPSKTGFATNLQSSGEFHIPYVLEQVLSARKYCTKAGELLEEAQELPWDERGASYDSASLCERLDAAAICLAKAHNDLCLSNALGFPRIKRPINAFNPPLSRDYILDMSVLRSQLVIRSFRVAPLASPAGKSLPPAVAADVWFDDPNRVVGTVVPLEGGKAVQILEQHTCRVHVPRLAQALSLIQDAVAAVTTLRDNAVALHRAGRVKDGVEEAFVLVQPSVHPSALEILAGYGAGDGLPNSVVSSASLR